MGKWELWCLRAKDGYLKGQVNLQVGIERIKKRMVAVWGKERFLSTGPMWFGNTFHVHEVTMFLFPQFFFYFTLFYHLVWASRFLKSMHLYGERQYIPFHNPGGHVVWDIAGVGSPVSAGQLFDLQCEVPHWGGAWASCHPVEMQTARFDPILRNR